MMEIFNKEKAVVYNTIQLYRHDRLHFLDISYKIANQQGFYLGMKLVRGAYMDKEESVRVYQVVAKERIFTFQRNQGFRYPESRGIT